MKQISFSFIFSILPFVVLFSQEPLRKKHLNLKDGIAIRGYDPVAYFKQNKAIMGKEDISISYQGATYYFSSIENKEIFRSNAATYEPEYGGWCAYAMGASGEKVSIDPATFKIANGKLYLFYNKFFNNTLPVWNKSESSLKVKADNNWSMLFK